MPRAMAHARYWGGGGGVAHEHGLGEQRRHRRRHERQPYDHRYGRVRYGARSASRKRAQARYALSRGSRPRTSRPTEEACTISDARRIPEATVARLPLYYRALLETADQEIGTVSSERLAELAGVNAAKVRKDLSYLGSYGTRGVGYDVEYLLHEISRELGLTHDWPVAIVGIGNLGQALANYRGFGARGFRIVAAVDADPEKVGRQVGELTVEALDDLPAIARDAGRRHRHHRHARARGAGGGRPARRRRRHVDPQLRPDGRDRARRRVAAQGRPRDRAADPLLLPAATRRRAGAAPTRAATASRGAALTRDDDRHAVSRPAITGYPVNLVRRRSALRRRRRRAHRGPQDRGAARRRRRRARGRARSSAPRCGPGPTTGRLDPRASATFDARRPRRRLARHHRHRRSRRSTGRCSRRARPAGSG